MQHHKIKQGIIFTSGLFSKKALEYAKKSNIWIERLEDPDIKKFEKRKEREEVKKEAQKQHSFVHSAGFESVKIN